MCGEKRLLLANDEELRESKKRRSDEFVAETTVGDWVRLFSPEAFSTPADVKVIEVLSNSDTTPNSRSLVDITDEDETDIDEDEKRPVRELLPDNRLGDGGLRLEPPAAPGSQPIEAVLDSMWPVCAILHTYIIPEEGDWQECMTRAYFSPAVSRLQIATQVEDEIDWWAAIGVIKKESPTELKIGGWFPTVAAAVLETCMTSIGDCKLRIRSTPKDDADPTFAIAKPKLLTHLPEGAIPVTVLIHTQDPGRVIGDLLIARKWASYIRRRFPPEERKTFDWCQVNPRALNDSSMCTNIYAKDCVLTLLTPRPIEAVLSDINLEAAFREDRHSQQMCMDITDRQVTDTRHPWSALPMGLSTFGPRPPEFLFVYEPYGETVIRVAPGQVLGLEFTLDRLEIPDDEDEENVPEFGRIAEGGGGGERFPGESRGSCSVSSMQRRRLKRLEEMETAQKPEKMKMVDESIELMSVKLLPHQRRAVAWMLEREESPQLGTSHLWQSKNGSVCNLITGEVSETVDLPRGGILADEMGLGKSVTTLACILMDPEARRYLSNEKFNLFKIGSDGFPEMAANESSDCTFDSRGRRMGQTLIVCPVNMVSEWRRMIRETTFVPDEAVADFHGMSRRKYTVGQLSKKLIVVTTYGTMATKKKDDEYDTMLHQIHWKRCVLDEAHEVRNAKTNRAQTILQLMVDHPWCLTGTPIQNKIQDLCTIFAFLKMGIFGSPTIFAHYFEGIRSHCNENVRLALGGLLLRRTKADLAKETSSPAPTPSLTDDATPPLISGNLPDKRVENLTITMSKEEAAEYERLRNLTREAVLQIERSSGSHIWSQFVALATQLRLLADSASILRPSTKALLKRLRHLPIDAEEARRKMIGDLLDTEDFKEVLQDKLETETCCICYDANPTAVTPCKHLFHKGCLEAWLSQGKGCPICRSTNPMAITMDQIETYERETAKEKDLDDLSGGHVSDKDEDEEYESTKVQTLVTRFAQHIQEGHPDGKPVKIVVFSNFVRFLRHLKKAIDRRGLRSEILDGSMSRGKRDKVVTNFQSSSASQILLASVKATGQGTTLTAGHIAYLCDPWWNPHVEEQAIGRVHRLGQTRDVQVYKVIMADTIEMSIVANQTKKTKLVGEALAKQSETSLHPEPQRTAPSVAELRNVLINLS